MMHYPINVTSPVHYYYYIPKETHRIRRDHSNVTEQTFKSHAIIGADKKEIIPAPRAVNA
jgi:hypothetical protein